MNATNAYQVETLEISTETANETRDAIQELNELELSFVGGGTGDVCF